jgi:hypothetical protein
VSHEAGAVDRGVIVPPERQRRIDIEILWPRIRAEAYRRRDELMAHEGCTDCWLNAARSAFASHAFRAPSWIVLGRDGIMARIRELA